MPFFFGRLLSLTHSHYRWDTLIVDEGQRLKGGTRGLLYKALQSLRIGSRVLLTGTPLNNSTGEVFNLLRFIDPNSRAHLTELEGRTTDLTTSAIDEIRSTLQKYMLRRTKELVLNLPPLVCLFIRETRASS